MKPHLPTDPAALRRAAEAQVKQRRPPNLPPLAADQDRLQQELEIHQIELEAQNENLLATQVKLQAALGRYTDLYDFAPAGYLTLARIIHNVRRKDATRALISEGNSHFGWGGMPTTVCRNQV